MNKPYISIVMPTARVGGLDMLFGSLENQTFKDFEIIIADSLYKYRKDIVKEKAKQYSIRYKHIQPPNDHFPSISYCHGVNAAITHASGNVILFTTDYHYFSPHYMKVHADFHMSSANNVGYTNALIPKIAPAPKQGLPTYDHDYERYIEDLENNKMQNYMWSSFVDEMDQNSPDLSTYADDPAGGFDPKRRVETGQEASPDIIHLQSDSIKTDIVLAANGLNEALDGSHGWQDIEFSYRLRNLFGFKWICDNKNVIYRTGSHRIVQRFQFTRPPGSNESIYQKYANGSKDVVNDWNIAEIRNQNLKENVNV